MILVLVPRSPVVVHDGNASLQVDAPGGETQVASNASSRKSSAGAEKINAVKSSIYLIRRLSRKKVFCCLRREYTYQIIEVLTCNVHENHARKFGLHV